MNFSINEPKIHSCCGMRENDVIQFERGKNEEGRGGGGRETHEFAFSMSLCSKGLYSSWSAFLPFSVNIVLKSTRENEFKNKKN